MSKKTEKAKAATTAQTAPANVTPLPGAATAATPIKAKKVTKPKVEVPQTPAQIAAKEALAKADADAHEELLKNSAGKIEAADKKIADAAAALKTAHAERKALNVALGIKGVFGGKKVSTLKYVKDYPMKGEGEKAVQTGAPQARAILEIVKAGGVTGVTREVVVKTMETAINTKMDRSRLLSYYTSRMVADGVISAE